MLKEISLFLDSGAHSFYMKKQAGKELGISFEDYFEDYMKFVDHNIDYLEIHVNLDVINDPEESFKNYMIMRKRGFAPIGVVHPGEDPAWIDEYLKVGCEYIGLGGLGQFFTRQKYVEWADEVWINHLTDSERLPKVKVHGFAVTAFQVMLRYPWYSVDSTSWVLTGRFGSVYVPKFRDGKYNFLIEPWKVAVSGRSPKDKDEGQHFNTFTPIEQERILKYFNENGYEFGKSDFKIVDECYVLEDNERFFGKADLDDKIRMNSFCQDQPTGFTKIDLFSKEKMVEIIVEPGLTNDYKLRDEMNIKYFLGLQNAIPKWPWKLNLKKHKTFGLR